MSMRRMQIGAAGCVMLAACVGPTGVRPFESPDRADEGAVGRPPTALRVRPPAFSEGGTLAAMPVLSGGTLAVLRDGHTAVAADPDLARVWVVDLERPEAPRYVRLQPGDEPGRVVEGPAGEVFVALRRADSVAVIDVASASVRARLAACRAPRGLAWDDASNLLRVACADGTLLGLTAAGEARARVSVAPDLRDVMQIRGDTFVTTLRSASLYRVRGETVTALPRVGETLVMGALRDTSVAWRALAVSGQVVMLAQHALQATLNDAPTIVGGYAASGALSGEVPVLPGVTFFDPNEGSLAPSPSVPHDATSFLSLGGLAVDVAVSPTLQQFVVASPGWAFGQGPAQVSVYPMPAAARASNVVVREDDTLRTIEIREGQAVAVAYTPGSHVVVQTRAPSGITFEGPDGAVQRLRLADATTRHVGEDVFHAVTPSGFACATCHPEGGDDGRTWVFRRAGARRTPSLADGVSQSAPFHWDGAFRDMATLASEVFERRMAGSTLTPQRVEALGRWLDAIPVEPTRGPSASSARGEALFNAPEVGCVTCHSGAQRSDNLTVDVGTGAALQVPRLRGLLTRAPYMHNGCAPTLRARFDDVGCGGGDQHGHTSQLSPAQVDDLVAYLETL